MNGPIPGALLAALLLYAATRGHPALAWLVTAPLFAACRGRRARISTAVVAATVCALAFSLLAHATWLAEAAQRYFAFSPPAALAIAIALCLGCALPFGVLLGVGLGCAARLRGTVLPVAAGAAAWVASESLARAIVPYYPWIGLAATQADVALVVQLASVGGQAALSFVVAAVGCALALVARGAGGGDDGCVAARSRRSTRARAAALAALLTGGTVAFGAARLAGVPPQAVANAPRPEEHGCTIAAVDAGIESGSLDAATVLDRYARVTARAAALRPDAIVWPESALPRDPLATPELLAALRGIARDSGAVLLVGGPRTAYDADWTARRYNTLFRIAAEGPVEHYDKREPVPFAERWPRGFGAPPAWLGLDPVHEGDAVATLRLGGCDVGALVCFEVERPGLAARAAASGADALVVASNDAELPATAIATEIAESRLRAVETGLPLLRAANRGASVAIDRYGRATPANDGVTLLAVGAAGPAPAVRWSGRVVAACWIILAATVLAATRAGWRAR